MYNEAEFIARDNRKAASSVVKRIWDAVQVLADQPHAGRAGRVHGTREMVVTGTPYIIPYRVVENTVQILRVLHGKRKWPKDFPKENDEAEAEKLISS